MQFRCLIRGIFKMKRKALLFGCIIGLVTAGIGILVVLFTLTDYPNHFSLSTIRAEGILGKVITLGSLLNLATFFWFLKKNKEFWAYGVVLATCLLTLLTVLI